MGIRRQEKPLGKVCILTTVHSPFDTRIFHKEAKTLVRAGYEVVLIAQHEKSEVVDGVKVVALPRPRNRFARIFGLTWQAFRLALRERADVYHFHDPELLPAMLVLRIIRQVPVIYDVHEDYRSSILQKRYLPILVRFMIAHIVVAFEKIGTRWFTIVLAERYYTERFPRGVTVLNYPVLDEVDKSSHSGVGCVDAWRVLYTGSVTEDRGALIHAGLVHIIPGLHVYLVGWCDPGLAERLYRVATPYEYRLHLEGVGYHVPYSRIQDYYTAGGWLAGLALFPPTEHYWRKELTKFFEYMMARIPIICSNFPVWKELVEGNRCGIAVDPLDPKAIAQAIEYLLTHPEEARRMGENGRRAVEERYNWGKEAEKLVRLYRNLLER
jgi:glycosyltransferase involved in cell wall biosynthesis